MLGERCDGLTWQFTKLPFLDDGIRYTNIVYGECTSEFLSISNIVEYQLPLSTHFAMHTPLMMYVMIVGAYTIAATDAAIPAPKTMYTVDVASYHNIV